MDRSRRQGAGSVAAPTAPAGSAARATTRRAPTAPPAAPPPAASKLTFRARRNRRRQGSLWSRVPRPRAIADACGRALRRSLPATAAIGVLAAIGGTAWAGYRFVTTSPRFAIEELSVRGNVHLTADQVRASQHARPGDNMFATSLDEVVRELRANPWIVDAEAHRVLPHTIEIAIRERTAEALAELGGVYLVDATGHPFKRAELDVDDLAGLPVLTGLDRAAYLADPDATADTLRRMLDAVASWRAEPSRPAIGEAHLDARGAVTLQLYDASTAIQLGALDANLDARLHMFDAAWTDLSDGERARARTIHLDTRPDHVTVAFARN
jgi:cell division protein FtsQ